MKRTKRIFSVLLVLVIMTCNLAVLAPAAQAAVSYDYSRLKVPENEAKASAVNYMQNAMVEYISRSTDLQNSLKNGNSLFFFFEGGSKNAQAAPPDYKAARNDALFMIVALVDGYPKVVYSTAYSTTFPDDPKAYGKYIDHYSWANDPDKGPGAVLDGIYSFTYGRYLKHKAYGLSGTKSVYLYKEAKTGYIVKGSSGILVHYRYRDKPNIVNSKKSNDNWALSMGCLLVGTGAGGSSKYSDFEEAMDPQTGKGYVIINRQLFRDQLVTFFNNNEAAVTSLLKGSDAYPVCSLSPHQQNSTTYETVKIGSKWVARCKECHTEYNYDAVYDANTAGVYQVVDEAPCCTAPYKEASNACLSPRISKTVNIAGSVRNAYNNLWYKTASGYWIYSSHLKYVSPPPQDNSTLKISPTKTSYSISKGSSCNVTGSITSNYLIKSVTATIDNNGKADWFSKSWKPNSTSVNIGNSTSGINSFSGAALGVGTHTLHIMATDLTGKTAEKNVTITVKGSTVATCAQPQITPASTDTEYGLKKVTIASATSGATIHYETEETSGSGTTPVTLKLAETSTVTAYATKSGMNKSATNTRTVSVPWCDAPTIETSVKAGGIQVTMTAAPGDEILYDAGSGERTYQKPFILTQSAEIVAYARHYGWKTSVPAGATVIAEAPAAPNAAVAGGAARIARGSAAIVRWDAAPYATAYEARLYKDGNMVDSQETDGMSAAFPLPETGIYEVRAAAKNFAGESPESAAVQIESMAPVTVTVVDSIVRTGSVTDAVVGQIEARENAHNGTPDARLEGNVISVQTVEYGAKAVRPETPSKKGFTFAGYSNINWNSPVTEDITVYAEYEVNTYTVRFYDSLSKQTLSTQNVIYTGSAQAPDGFAVPSGYAVTGWSVDNAATSGLDYTYVEGNMTLGSVYAWANTDLPTELSITGVTRSRDCSSYRVDIEYTNNDYASTKAKVIVSLYTAEGKMVYTQVADIHLDPTEIGSSVNGSVQLNYSGLISRATAVLVRADNDKTGGAVSEMAASTDITQADNSGYWSEWSEWSAEPAVGSDTRQVESKTQYSYRDRSYTSADTKTLSEGWIQYNSTESVGSWVDNGKTAVTAFTNDAQKREVTSADVPATYKTQYHYCRYWGKGSCPWTFSNSSHPNFEEIWLDKEMPYKASVSSGSIYKYYDNTNYGKANNKYWLRGKDMSKSWTRAVQTGGGYTTYQYRDTFYTYYFYRWSDWSAYADAQISATSDREVRSRTVYRYRDYNEVYDPSLDTSSEEPTVMTYALSGTLPGVDGDFAGKLATVLVYKKTNTDPTQEQLEYVDQITLGEGNTYSFTVNPKEVIDYTGTGDYIVTLSVEGSEALVNVDVIRAPVPTYTVEFYANGTPYRTVAANDGQSVDVNEVGIPQVDGYRFVKWDRSVVNIHENLLVNAVMERETYHVAVVDHKNGTAQLIKLTSGNALSVETPAPRDDAVFDGWALTSAVTGEAVDGSAPDFAVTEDLIATAQWIPITHAVTFYDYDDSVLETQNVTYGGAAEPPAFEAVPENMLFLGWSTDVPWWNVTEALEVRPLLAYEETVQLTSNLGTYTIGEYELLELYADEGGDIFYTLDGSTPNPADMDEEETSTFRYDGPITLSEDAEIHAVASVEGKNSSEELILVFEYAEDVYSDSPYDMEELGVYEVIAQPGKEIELRVNIEGNPGLVGYLFSVECDKNVFYVDMDENTDFVFTPGDVSQNGTLLCAPYEEEGWQFFWYSAEESEGDGNLFTVTLKVNDAAEAGTYPIRVCYSPANTVTEEDVSAEKESLTAAFFSDQNMLLGDVDGDGVITAVDVVRIARYLINDYSFTSGELAAADVTGDNAVTAADVIRLSRYMVGLAELG